VNDSARRAYDQDERTQPYEPEAKWVETDGVGGFWSPLYGTGWILAPPPDDLEHIVRVRDAVRAAAGTHPTGDIEWKCFSWDGAAAWYADGALQDAGFVPAEEKAILIADARELAGTLTEDVRNSAAPRNPGIAVRIATDEADHDAAPILEAADSVDYETWGAKHPPSRVARGYWAGGAVCSIHVAFLDNAPVSYGRFQATPGSRFGGLWGGATIASARNRGCYRALVVSRAREAIRRNLRWLMVDANPATSMPILLHHGFRQIGSTRPYTYSPKPG